MSELVKCGCGGEAVICGVDMSSIDEHDACYVFCKKCGIETKMYDYDTEAVKAWNKAMGADHICKNCKNYDGSYCKFDNEYSIAEDYGCNCFERRES